MVAVVSADGAQLTIRLGPYDLDAPLGRGGMGEVWTAVHHELGTAVAIKFLTAEGLRQAGFLKAFQAEARAVAALDHPAIVRVHDAGEVHPETSLASQGRIPRGTPWLAMERVGGGTLAPLVGRLRWQELHAVVLSLLDALAHAHARGVVHRDLKPSNVLVLPPQRGDAALHVKLTDFGLAQAVDERGELDVPFAGGTPSYMAPEQFESRWRDFGPWSDLYAFGALVWCLVSGEPPFGRADGRADKRHQHFRQTPPALRAHVPLPPGFEPWLRLLLEKDPKRRFRRAADAREQFLAMGDPFATPLPAGRADGMALVAAAAPRPDEVPTLTFDEDPDAAVHLPLGPCPTPVARFVPSWRAAGTPPPPPPLGLGLFGMRPVPLVGRQRERDALWAALGAVHRDRQARAVVLRGAPGVGKTRLARWLAERAHELGAASTMEARHRAVGGPEQGLGPMLRGFLRCHGLERERTLSRIRGIYAAVGVDHGDEWHALTEVVCPAREEDTVEVRFASPTERYVTVRRLVQTVAAERPVVLVFDDAHFGLDALRFVAYLLRYPAKTGLPVLAVLTVTDGAFSDRIDCATQLEELLEHERCSTVAVGPLPREDRPALVGGLLGLEPELAARVEAHTAGNPQFAVELVGDWVRAGRLAPGPRGFRGPPDLQLPRDLAAMWQQRVEQQEFALTAGELRALELAAVLGMDVDVEEWVGACARAEGADPSDHLVQQLLDRGLAEPRAADAGFSFAHASVRDAVLRTAQRFGRLREAHAIAARLLADRVRTLPSWPAGLSERVGLHWVGAEEPQLALSHLLEGVVERRDGGDPPVAEALLTAYETALRAAGVPAADERWGQGYLQRVELVAMAGRRLDADRWLRTLTDEARAHGWSALSRRARLAAAHEQREQGQYPAALEALADVEREAAKAGDRELMARVRQEIGETQLASGDLEAAERWLRLALADFRTTADDAGCARCWRSLGDALKERGAYEEANELLVQAERTLSARGHRLGVATALNSRGEVARARGDLKLANKLYRRARGLFKAIGSQAWIIPEYNRALLYLAVEDFSRAKPILELSLHRFHHDRKHAAAAHAHLALARCAAADAAWLLFDEHFAEAARILERTGYADEDTAALAQAVGEATVPFPDRALGAWALARRLWRTLGRVDRQQQVERLLGQLGGQAR